MRKLAFLSGAVLSVLALGACDTAHNSDIRVAGASESYGSYSQQREAALTGQAAMPHLVPTARPYNSPNADELNGTVGRDQPAPVRTSYRGTPVTSASPFPGDIPVLVSYAAESRNPVGQRVYIRAQTDPQAAARSCARYQDADTAQMTFLQQGGPQQDPLGIDPDGDGYACGWNPASYRLYVR